MPDDAEIRAKLREAFRTFTLPRTMPAVGSNSHEVIEVNGGRNRTCSACGEVISGTAEGSLAYNYPEGRMVYFHERCEQLWQEERHARPPDARR
jgi:hypothetical protein